jgi:RNA polymerase sigma-70 factor (ECF subfamily)
MLFNKKYKNFADEELMLLIGNNDSKAFEELYKRYGRKIHYYFFKMLGYDAEKANDFTQDIFMKIIEKNDSYNRATKFQTWLYTIATNMCKNDYKHKEIKLKHEEEYKYTTHTFYVTKFDNTYDHKVFKENLEKELEELEINHKTTFILRYQQDLSIREIAEIMDCSEGTVKSRIYYTLQKLSQKLKTFNQILENDIWKSN